MKISFHKGYILIISDKFVTILGKIIGLPTSMGVTLFPCIIVFRNLTHPMTSQWLIHEQIHIHQLSETLYLIYPFAMLEYLYARIFLKYTHMQAYMYECLEQEAYLNQNNSEYLNNRKIFSTFKYIKHKTKFNTDKNYHVVMDE